MRSFGVPPAQWSWHSKLNIIYSNSLWPNTNRGAQMNWKHRHQNQQLSSCATFNTIHVIAFILVRREWQCAIDSMKRMAVTPCPVCSMETMTSVILLCFWQNWSPSRMIWCVSIFCHQSYWYSWLGPLGARTSAGKGMTKCRIYIWDRHATEGLNVEYQAMEGGAKYTWIRRNTVYPKKYAHGFVVLCFVVVMQSFIMNSHEVFIHIHQGCFAGTGAIVRLPQCQWSKPDGYGKISQRITTTKHSKAKTVCIFLGIYCRAEIILGSDSDVWEEALLCNAFSHWPSPYPECRGDIWCI